MGLYPKDTQAFILLSPSLKLESENQVKLMIKWYL